MTLSYVSNILANSSCCQLLVPNSCVHDNPCRFYASKPWKCKPQNWAGSQFTQGDLCFQQLTHSFCVHTVSI